LDIGFVLVAWAAAAAVDALDIAEEVLDGPGEDLVGRTRGKLEWTDHVGVHWLRRIGCEVRQPVRGGQVVPCGRGISVHRGEDVRRILSGTRGGRGLVLGCVAGTLEDLTAEGRLADYVAQLIDEAGREVPPVVPEVD
jgi:hypothetical protein